MANASSHYAYFENLEKTIKIALAIYVVLLLLSVAALALGSSPSMISYAKSSPFSMVLLGAATLAGYVLLLRGIRRVHWIGELHIWLDRKFFGFLSRSNEIIFQTLLFALRPAERDQAYELSPHDRETMAETIFSKLASSNQLFPTLLRSGIFRLWIWYWVTNYGTAIFSLLVIVAFPLLFFGSLAFTKAAFAVFWAMALGHLFAGLWLGSRLLRMTKEVSEDIVKSYSQEIAAILRAQLASFQR
jgi:hypothetical protein